MDNTDEELKVMYLNYVNNLINYFKITDITGFREAMAIHIKHQPNVSDEEEVKKWCNKLSEIIQFYTTLSEIELSERRNAEFEMVDELAKELEVKSEEKPNA